MITEQFLKEYVSRSLSEERFLLSQMEAGTHRAPWATDQQHLEAIAECKERIASMVHKLENPQAMQEWWDEMPLDGKQEVAAMLNE